MCVNRQELNTGDFFGVIKTYVKPPQVN
jgi:hypothetical protein